MQDGCILIPDFLLAQSPSETLELAVNSDYQGVYLITPTLFFKFITGIK